MKDLTKEIDDIIIKWSRSGNENTTQCAYLINKFIQNQKKLFAIPVVIGRLFTHKHKWQKRGTNRYGTTTYRMCLKCRETQKRVNKSYEPDRFEACTPIKYLDAQFDKDDNYILNGL